MAERYTKRSAPWADGPPGGTLITAGDLNRMDDGSSAVDQALVTAETQLQAVQAQLVTLTDGRIPSGTTSERPPPAVGQMFFDKTINRPIIGNGTAWIEFGAGGDPVPGPGGSGAPQNFQAVAQPDNSILTSWDAVAGASHYKLYEVRSPDGVSGATNLTTTSSLRTPSTMGYYEYWATAFVDGIESAQSNHGITSLPYGSTPGEPGGSAGSPAELLALGGSGGKWNLGVGYPSGHVDIAPSTLEAGWTEAPYFYLNDAGTHVHFQTPMNGGKTSSNTSYARTELREFIGSNRAAWNGGSGTHVMSYRATVLHLESGKPECVIGQIHDGDDDTLQIRIEGTTWRASINGTKHSTSLGSFSWGTEVAVEVRLVSGTLTIRINGSTKITTNPGYGSGNYFKIGMYPQQNNTSDGGGNPSNGYASCLLRDLVVSHS